MKLFELRPPAAIFTTSTPGFASCLNPAPQPASSVTVESPTSTTRIGGGACGSKAATRSSAARLNARKERTSSCEARSARFTGASLIQTSRIRVRGALDVPCQAQRLERADTNPVEIQLVPRETVTRARRMGVMVVVPAFSECEQRHPPVVGGIIAGLEAARTPLVGG